MKYPCRLNWQLDARTGKWSCIHGPYQMALTPATEDYLAGQWDFCLKEGDRVITNIAIDGDVKTISLIDCEDHLAHWIKGEQKRLTKLLELLEKEAPKPDKEDNV